jgi:hypothetical protein
MRGFIPRRLPALLGGDRADELPSEPSNCLRVAVDRLTRRILDDPEPTTTSSAFLTREELADLVGDPVERVREQHGWSMWAECGQRTDITDLIGSDPADLI